MHSIIMLFQFVYVCFCIYVCICTYMCTFVCGILDQIADWQEHFFFTSCDIQDLAMPSHCNGPNNRTTCIFSVQNSGGKSIVNASGHRCKSSGKHDEYDVQLYERESSGQHDICDDMETIDNRHQFENSTFVKKEGHQLDFNAPGCVQHGSVRAVPKPRSSRQSASPKVGTLQCSQCGFEDRRLDSFFLHCRICMALSTLDIQFHKDYDKYARGLLVDKTGSALSEEEFKAVRPVDPIKFGDGCTKVRCSFCRTVHSKRGSIVFHLVDIHHFNVDQVSKWACVIDGHNTTQARMRLNIFERLWTDRYRETSHTDDKVLSAFQMMIPPSTSIRKCKREHQGAPEAASHRRHSAWVAFEEIRKRYVNVPKSSHRFLDAQEFRESVEHYSLRAGRHVTQASGNEASSAEPGVKFQRDSDSNSILCGGRVGDSKEECNVTQVAKRMRLQFGEESGHEYRHRGKSSGKHDEYDVNLYEKESSGQHVICDDMETVEDFFCEHKGEVGEPSGENWIQEKVFDKMGTFTVWSLQVSGDTWKQRWRRG